MPLRQLSPLPSAPSRLPARAPGWCSSAPAAQKRKPRPRQGKGRWEAQGLDDSKEGLQDTGTLAGCVAPWPRGTCL